MPIMLTAGVWVGWLAAVLLALAYAGGAFSAFVNTLVVVDGLTLLMWIAIGFFSGVVHAFSYRYLTGSRGRVAFYSKAFGFTVCASVFVAAHHLALLWLSWLAMGWCIARLIGYHRDWPQAQQAARLAQRRFLLSAVFLALGLLMLYWTTGSVTIHGAMAAITGAETTMLPGIALAFILAAAIQCALVPMHSWLLSSMTAPTPASALMHAGFVNGGGILLTRFAPIVVFDQGLLTLLLVIGAISAMLGKVMKAMQPEIKRQLGCSTVGQMGFMMMQVGLGFFSAAITHLILHGCYKAYLFLAAGERIAHLPPESDPTPHPRHAWVSVCIGVLVSLAGAGLFAMLTGKGQAFNSGLLLAFFVALTVLHATRDVVQNTALPPVVRLLGVPVVFFPLITLYSVIFNAVTQFIAPLPAVNSPTPLTVWHGLIAATFLGLYIALELRWQQRATWLYPKLLNLAQPLPSTVMVYKRDYHAK
jgi:NAD(P)H-quinone oxidoreductase subunit 5